MEALVVGSVFTILGSRLSPNKRNSSYAVGIGILLGLLMSRRTGTNRVDWLLKKNNLKRVKGRDLQKVGMSLKDVTRYGDILGFDLREGADKKQDDQRHDQRHGNGEGLTTAAHAHNVVLITPVSKAALTAIDTTSGNFSIPFHLMPACPQQGSP